MAMTHVDCNRFPRDCGNCAHSVRRHMPDNPVQNTLVCLRNACGVRPDQLKATQHTPCGTAIDVIDGLVPRHWKRADTYPKVEPPKDVNGEPIYVGEILRKVFNGEDTDIIVKVSGIASDTIFVEYDRNGRDYEMVSDIMMSIPFYEVLAKCFRHIDYGEEA